MTGGRRPATPRGPSARAVPRPSSRPSAAGSSRPSSAGSASQRPRARGTSRGPAQGAKPPSRALWAVVLAFVLVVVAVVLAPSLRTYVAQRSDIEETRREVAAKERTVERLRAQRKAWDDPAYVEQQARDRLKFVRPGEKVYTVVDTRPQEPEELSPVTKAVRSASDQRSWFGDVWRSVEVAGAGE